MANAVLMPKAGITVESCIIGKWEKKVGDQIAEGDILFTYETDKAAFECESTAAGELLEYAEYVNNYYGTSLKAIQQKLESGVDVLLDIEVQGAAKVRARCPDALFIFIIPPSFEELSRRLHRRNTDSEDVIAGRLEKARVEFREIPNYDYLVINDKVSGAVAEIEAVLTAAECRVENRKSILTQFA